MSLLAALRRAIVGTRGFSAIETAGVMAVGSMLSALAAPAVDAYVAQAQMTKAMNDTRVIAVALVRLTLDVGRRARDAGGWNETVLLVGGGETPRIAPGGDPEWLLQPGA